MFKTPKIYYKETKLDQRTTFRNIFKFVFFIIKVSYRLTTHEKNYKKIFKGILER